MLADFGILKSLEFNTKSTEGVRNLARLKLLASIYQSLIQFKTLFLMKEGHRSDHGDVQYLLEKLVELSLINKDVKLECVLKPSVLRYLVAVILFPALSGEDPEEVFIELQDSEPLKHLMLKFAVAQCESTLWYNSVNNRSGLLNSIFESL